MEDNRIAAAREGVQNMLFYYLTSLIESGVKDPKQYIATEIGKMINLSDEQRKYIEANLALEDNISKGLSQCISMLKNMENAKEIDAECFGIIVNILSRIQEEYSRESEDEDEA